MSAAPSAALVAALKGEFGKSYDGRRLRPATQATLVALFAGRGEALVDVIQHLSINKDNESGWRESKCELPRNSSGAADAMAART